MDGLGIDKIPLRLVLLGKTGVGKSATGNIILGKKVFVSETRAASVTKECKSDTCVISQQRVTLIDTPGLYDTTASQESIIREIVKGIELAVPGPHGFLLILDVRRHTEEERNTVKAFQEIFGDDVCNHIIVVFTHGDDLEFDNKTIEDYIVEAGPDLQNLITACKNRYHVFNNRSKDRMQLTAFMKKINTMMKENKHAYYSYGLFTTAQALKEAKENETDRERRLAEMEKQLQELLKRQKKCILL